MTTMNLFTHRSGEIHQPKWLENPRLNVQRSMFSDGKRTAVDGSSFPSRHEREFDTDRFFADDGVRFCPNLLP